MMQRLSSVVKEKVEAYVVSGVQEERKIELLDNLSIAVEKVQNKFENPIHNKVVKEGKEVENLSSCLEDIFQHGLREKLFQSSARQQESQSFWAVIQKMSVKEEIQSIYRLEIIQTDANRCRAWIRMKLKDHTIGSYIGLLTENAKLLKEFYNPNAFLRDGVKTESVRTLLQYVIASLDFYINVEASGRYSAQSSNESSGSRGTSSPRSDLQPVEIVKKRRSSKKRFKTPIISIAQSNDLDSSSYVSSDHSSEYSSGRSSLVSPHVDMMDGEVPRTDAEVDGKFLEGVSHVAEPEVVPFHGNRSKLTLDVGDNDVKMNDHDENGIAKTADSTLHNNDSINENEQSLSTRSKLESLESTLSNEIVSQQKLENHDSLRQTEGCDGDVCRRTDTSHDIEKVTEVRQRMEQISSPRNELPQNKKDELIQMMKNLRIKSNKPLTMDKILEIIPAHEAMSTEELKGYIDECLLDYFSMGIITTKGATLAPKASPLKQAVERKQSKETIDLNKSAVGAESSSLVDVKTAEGSMHPHKTSLLRKPVERKLSEQSCNSKEPVALVARRSLGNVKVSLEKPKSDSDTKERSKSLDEFLRRGRTQPPYWSSRGISSETRRSQPESNGSLKIEDAKSEGEIVSGVSSVKRKLDFDDKGFSVKQDHSEMAVVRTASMQNSGVIENGETIDHIVTIGSDSQNGYKTEGIENVKPIETDIYGLYASENRVNHKTENEQKTSNTIVETDETTVVKEIDTTETPGEVDSQSLDSRTVQLLGLQTHDFLILTHETEASDEPSKTNFKKIVSNSSSNVKHLQDTSCTPEDDDLNFVPGIHDDSETTKHSQARPITRATKANTIGPIRSKSSVPSSRKGQAKSLEGVRTHSSSDPKSLLYGFQMNSPTFDSTRSSIDTAQGYLYGDDDYVTDSETDTYGSGDNSEKEKIRTILADLGVNDDIIGLKEDHFATPDNATVGPRPIDENDIREEDCRVSVPHCEGACLSPHAPPYFSLSDPDEPGYQTVSTEGNHGASLLPCISIPVIRIERENKTFMGFTSDEELENAIETCKDRVKSLSIDSQERKHLVRKLVQLRLKLHEQKEAPTDNVANSKIILGHRFVKEGKAPGNYFCDSCGSTIWALVHTLHKCIDCSFHCHRKCLLTVDKPCVSKKVSGSVYITDIAPESGLSNQQYRCADCRRRLIFKDGSFQARICDYTGQFYCSNCHWNETQVVPARVIHNWDFVPRRISRQSKHLLNLLSTRPIICLKELNPALFNFVQDLQDVRALREQILSMKKYLVSCRLAVQDKLLLLLKERQHFVENSDMYTMQDLITINTGVLLEELSMITATFGKHIKFDCVLCQGRGFICEICRASDVIFPFDFNSVKCNVCLSTFHRACYRKGSCPKCKRMSNRKSTS